MVRMYHELMWHDHRLTLRFRQQEVFKAIESARLRFGGRLDILVNNAGVVAGKGFIELTETDIDQTLNVNVRGPLNTIRAVLPKMMLEKRGHIVNVSSVVADMYSAGYCECARVLVCWDNFPWPKFPHLSMPSFCYIRKNAI